MMKQRVKLAIATLCAIFAVSLTSTAAVTVSGLDDLAANLKKSNVELKMKAGVYNMTSGSTITIEGSNSSYDFADVKFEADGTPTIKIVGSGNAVKNLSAEGVAVVMEGATNTLEGVTIVTTTANGAEGASAVVVSGEGNQVKGCKITLRNTSHAITIAGAKNPTISGCEIEGAMYTSDGYTLSKVGDGIRTCDKEFSGNKISGKVMVVGCTVKYVRRGIDLFLGDGSRYVENCTMVGCQEGYSVNNGGMIVNCKADSAFGPALWVEGETTTNVTADITLMPYSGEKFEGNKSGHVMFIQGLGHKITIKQNSALALEAGQTIAIGGDCNTIAYKDKVENLSAANMTITNESGYTVKIGGNTSYNTIITGSDVEGNTYDNTIEEL
ncbi:MAG: hypothetical protein SNH35_06395 [Rikenellaceae bacterium]